MIKIPNVLNTKADYEFIRYENISGWEDKFRQLLEGRFVIDGDNLVEDKNAPIFRLGFTVAEVASSIGFSGLTDREVTWRESQPDRWQFVDDEWQEIDGWSAARSAIKFTEALNSKIAEIQTQKRAVRDSGVTIDGVLFDTDAFAQIMYTQFLVAVSYDASYTIQNWKASGETFVTMDAALIIRIKTAWAELCAKVHNVQAQKISEVSALTNIGEIESYDVSVGWK